MAKSKNQTSLIFIGLSFGVILYLLNIIFSFFVSDSYAGFSLNSLVNLPSSIGVAILLLTGFLFALGYGFFYPGLPGRGWQKGLHYAFWLWLVGAVPAFFTVLVSISVPLEVVITWISLRLAAYLLLGVLIGWMYKS